MTARGNTTTGNSAQAVGGWSYLLSFFLTEYTDPASRRAAQRVLAELSVFYLLIIIGFGFLWFTWRSNAKLKEWKAQVSRTIASQRGRAFEPQDAAKLYGMF